MVARKENQRRDGSGESTMMDEKRPLLLFLPPEGASLNSSGEDKGKLIGSPSSDHDPGDEEEGNNHPGHDAAFQHYQSIVMQHRHAPLLLLQQQERMRMMQQQQQQQQLRKLVLSVCTALLVVAILCWPWVFLSANDHERKDHYFFSSRPKRKDHPCRKHWWNFIAAEKQHCPPFRDSKSVNSIQKDSHASSEKHGEAVRPQQTKSPTLTISSEAEAATATTSQIIHKENVVISNNPRVSSARHPHFPSFLEFEKGRPIDVQYNAQAILLNGQPSLLLGGSLHPTRVSAKASWENALDEAVHNGLNLITIYVFWSAHQPFEHSTLDWTLPYSRDITLTSSRSARRLSSEDSGDRWTLADAVTSCANRGMFVHIRLGPYVCAEYSLGGIPEWIPALYPDIRMRRMDPIWLKLMEGYVQNATAYLTQHNLWAHQGGPIILAQIENELGDEDTGFMMPDKNMEEDGNKVEEETTHISEIQEYANWCGDLVRRVAPKQIVWTMCNGLTANNTILTFNGDWNSLSWLQHQNERPGGRVQVDQPALWTEDEQGFQVWGESPEHPVDYFWGISARDVSKNAMRWVARQGLHVNYYMWFGSYNHQRAAGAGIMNAYAADAVLCPSGERREPKFGHLTKMHKALADVAPLLTDPHNVVPVKPESVEVLNARDGSWSFVDTGEIASFTYRQHQPENDGSDDAQTEKEGTLPTEAIFVENNRNNTAVIRVASTRNDGDSDDKIIFSLKPYSVALLVDGIVAFGSATLGPDVVSFKRTTVPSFVPLLDWNSWKEDPNGVSCENGRGILSRQPIEQTALHQGNLTQQRFWSDYSWYTTTFSLIEPIAVDINQPTSAPAKLHIDTDKGVGMLVYIDGVFQGSSENHEHKEGSITLEIPLLQPLSAGPHKLAILAENFGYHNLIGRWGGRVGLKPKGIVGNVTLETSSGRISLTDLYDDDAVWCSVAGSQGEQLGLPVNSRVASSWISHNQDGPVWSWAFFDTPMFDSYQHLFLDVTKGRGHVWLNGHDLGRYWNIRRSNDPGPFNAGSNSTHQAQQSQRYYHLSEDLLTTDGSLNELVFFDVEGDAGKHDQIVLSWLEPSSSGHYFEDSIGFAESCLI